LNKLKGLLSRERTASGWRTGPTDVDRKPVGQEWTREEKMSVKWNE